LLEQFCRGCQEFVAVFWGVKNLADKDKSQAGKDNSKNNGFSPSRRKKPGRDI
jgi:hypothetical protein